MKINNEWFRFFFDLIEYDLYYKDEVLPKFIAFWNRYSVDDLLKGKRNVKAVKKK